MKTHSLTKTIIFWNERKERYTKELRQLYKQREQIIIRDKENPELKKDWAIHIVNLDIDSKEAEIEYIIATKLSKLFLG